MLVDLAKEGKVAGSRTVELLREGVEVMEVDGSMKQGRPGLARVKVR